MRFRRSKREQRLVYVSHEALGVPCLLALSPYERAERRTLRRWVVAGLVLCELIAIVGVLRLVEMGKLSGRDAAAVLGVVLGAVNVTLYVVVKHLFPGPKDN